MIAIEEAGADMPGLSCLQIVADPDPGCLVRVLSHFQILNRVPRRVWAQVDSTGLLHIWVDTTGLSVQQLRLIGAKIEHMPAIQSLRLCRSGPVDGQ